MTTASPSPSTCKVSAAKRACKSPPFVLPAFEKPSSPPRLKNRRDLFGGRRGQGNRRRSAVQRLSAERIGGAAPHPSLTSFGGLVDFDAFLDRSGYDQRLRSLCAPLKTAPGVVYPMHAQVRLLLDLLVIGGTRIFDLERIAHDPLVCTLAGGPLCSLDTLYRDIERFDEASLSELQELVESVCLDRLATLAAERVHLDIDTTVMPVMGEEIEGAVVGYNPRYRGRPSYHPVVARVAETGMFFGARLRPGNTTFGEEEAALVGRWTAKVRRAMGASRLLYVRIDKAGHCGAVLRAIEEQGAFYLVKAQTTEAFQKRIGQIEEWTTLEVDANDEALEQVAEFEWRARDNERRGLRPMRVIVVRSRERKGSEQLHFWPELEMSVQVLVTNDTFSAAEDLLSQYDGRAGIEPLIAEAKQSWGLEAVSSKSFLANEALLQLKLLALNLLHAMSLGSAPKEAKRWRTEWQREYWILRPGLLVRSGRALRVRLNPRPMHLKRN